METNAFTRELGTRQGRIMPEGVTPPTGDYVFCLGYDGDRFEPIAKDDFVSVSQTATFSVGTKLLRATAIVRAPKAAPPLGLRWALQLLVDGVVHAEHILVPGARMRTRQLAANVSKLASGSHTLTLRLIFSNELPAGTLLTQDGSPLLTQDGSPLLA